MAFTCNNLQMRNPLYLMKLILFQKSLNLIYISLLFDVNLVLLFNFTYNVLLNYKGILLVR